MRRSADAGGQREPLTWQDVTFIFTDQDVINENFLEIMNSILATGEADSYGHGEPRGNAN